MQRNEVDNKHVAAPRGHLRAPRRAPIAVSTDARDACATRSALIFTYWLWLKAVKNGSLMWASFCALSYFYMVRQRCCATTTPPPPAPAAAPRTSLTMYLVERKLKYGSNS